MRYIAMRSKAYAKINLCLNVVGKREDNYHELEMIMLPLTLHDTIHIQFANQDTYTCSDSTLTMDETNTVVKAVQLMRKTYGITKCFKIHVEKQIPAQAGLAGGSADAAAIMRAVNKLCNLSIPIEELAQLGKEIGADVPFCVLNQPAIVKGIGEKLTPFFIHKPLNVLLVKPTQGVPTGKAFSMLDFIRCDHPNVDKVKQYILENKYEQLQEVIGNSLEYSAFQLVPEIQTIKEELLQTKGCYAVLMSGSGSTVFALYEDSEQIQAMITSYKDKNYFVCCTSVYTKKGM